MIVSYRLRVFDLRESRLLSMQVAISHCYEFGELSAVADGFGFRDADPEAEATADLVRQDLGVPPVRPVLETHGLV